MPESLRGSFPEIFPHELCSLLRVASNPLSSKVGEPSGLRLVGEGGETGLGEGGGADITGGFNKGGGVFPSLFASISLIFSQSSFHSFD